MQQPTKDSVRAPHGNHQQDAPLAIPPTAPSRGNDIIMQNAKEAEKLRSQKVRIADASSAPAVSPADINQTSKGGKSSKLRLADGAAQVVGATAASTKNKDVAKNPLRLAPGHQTENGGDLSESTKKDMVKNPLRLAPGHEAEDGGDVSASTKNNKKKDVAKNPLRLAPGHEGENVGDSSRNDTAHSATDNRDESNVNDDVQDPLQAEVAETVDVEALLDKRLPTASVTRDEELEDDKSKWKRVAWWVFVVLFVVGTGGVIAAILLTRQTDDGTRSSPVEPTIMPTPAPTDSYVPSYNPSNSPTSRMAWIKGLLEAYMEDTTPWDDETTVQFEALQWMEGNWWIPDTTDDAAIELAMVQRYAAFVVFLELAGEREKAAFSEFAGLDTCLWSFGIGLNDSAGLFCTDGEVTEVAFYHNDLPDGLAFEIAGTIPTEIGLLSSLRWFGIDNNLISGTLPSQLFHLSKLESLLLPNNIISGTLPDMRFAPSLLEVELSNNLLSGKIDNAMNPNLSILYLFNNNMSGVLPSEIGALDELSGLDLYGNSFEGPIPDEIQHMTSLTLLLMGKNALDQSTIPVGFGHLTHLTALGLQDTQISGTIPIELGQLTLLTNLQLWGNQLIGTIPDTIQALTELTSLGLSSNSLTGTIPTECGLLTNLNHLNFNSNELEGTLPSELGLLTGLDFLSVSRNPGVTGRVPDTLRNLSHIKDAYFYGTNLTSGLESLFCGLNLDDFWADCGHTKPEINCECCTVCCSSFGTSCRYV